MVRSRCLNDWETIQNVQQSREVVLGPDARQQFLKNDPWNGHRLILIHQATESPNQRRLRIRFSSPSECQR